MIWPRGHQQRKPAGHRWNDPRFRHRRDGVRAPAGEWPTPRLQAINDLGVAVGFSECSCSNSDRTLQSALVWDAANGSRTIPVPAAKELLACQHHNVAVGNIRGGSAGTEGFPVQRRHRRVREHDRHAATLPVRARLERAARHQRNRCRLWTRVGRSVRSAASPGPRTRASRSSRPFPAAWSSGCIHVDQRRGDGGRVCGSYLHQPAGFRVGPAARHAQSQRPGPGPANFILDWATQINDQGWIVGIGHYGPAWGTSRGFVLTPRNSTTAVDDPRISSQPAALTLLTNPVSDRLASGSRSRWGARLAVDLRRRRAPHRAVVDAPVSPGAHTVFWNPSRALSSGVYIVRLEAEGVSNSVRFVLLR